MATVATVSNRWIPEDDLLLKNAAEAGASLEALAKGAIQFSRRYTLQELRERWYSLLYDPDTSTEAADRLFELEISGFNPVSKLNKSEKDFSKKRKYENIRKKYYALRKKLRSNYFNNDDLRFFESNSHEFSMHDVDFQNQAMRDDNNPLGKNCIIGDGLSYQLGLQEDDLDILRHAFPGTVNEKSSAQNEIMGGYGFDENVNPSSREGGTNILEIDTKNRNSSVDENPHGSSFQMIVYSSNQSHLRQLRTMQDVSDPPFPANGITPNDDEGKENSSSVYTGEFADPDSLLNLLNEDEMLSEGVDEKHAENICSIDNSTDLVIQECNKDGQENDTGEIEPNKVTFSEASSILAPSVDSTDLKVDVRASCDLVEISHGKICCTLNTEDPEIPCNDDIFLLIHPSMSFGSSATQPNSRISMNTCDKGSNKVDSRVLNSVQPVGSKTDIPGFVNKAIVNSRKGRSLYTTPKPCSRSLAKKEVVGVDMKVGDCPETTVPSLEAGSASTYPLPEPLVDDSVSDHEGFQIDDDVPYFSDVEAMILEMDLDPDDQDSHINRQVPSYQYDDTKRTIIRLEQAAGSCLRRAMSSQGALAILYGRHLRHYIKKPEVLLGRSTDDLDVDIDLRKEGRANKISRRQAIIKMESDGSFFLKNLGKSSVSVNGMTVVTGQLLNLSSSCLIEIKGMSFVFEINQGYVKKHLGKLLSEK